MRRLLLILAKAIEHHALVLLAPLPLYTWLAMLLWGLQLLLPQ